MVRLLDPASYSTLCVHVAAVFCVVYGVELLFDGLHVVGADKDEMQAMWSDLFIVPAD